METISDLRFSSYSDVWSFGVVLWEFFSLGQEPYTDIDSQSLYQKLESGYRLDKPDNATQEMYILNTLFLHF